MSLHVVAMIPARMEASRFPGKPLCSIAGLSMIEHVRRRVALSEAVDDVVVATCNQEIIDEVARHGGTAVMTRNDHERCTDRIAEAAQGKDFDVVIIVQGDEPTFLPDVLEDLVAPMRDDPSVLCTNLLSVISDPADLDDIDIVKAVTNRAGDVMYFSRAPIPHQRVKNDPPMFRQTGVSAFRRDFLMTFTGLEPTPLEIAESVDFLRILEHGHRIKAVIYDRHTAGVDRAEDVPVVEAILRDDPVQREMFDRIKGD